MSDVAHGAMAIADAVEEGTPAVLLRYQQEAIMLSDENELFVEEKSRRTGLTYGFAANAVIKAAPAVRPKNTYYIGYNRDMAREFIGYCGDFAIAFNEVAHATGEFLFDDGSEEGIKAYAIDFPSGKSIIALSSRPRSLRGMQGDVIIDEAAYHDDLEAVLDAAMALTMWGGHVVVISTHNGADNFFNELIEQIRSKKRDGVVHRTTLADALADGLFKRICLRTGENWSPEAEAEWERKLRKRYGTASEQELDVVPAKGAGAYLPRATIEACQVSEHRVVRLVADRAFHTAGGLINPNADDELLPDNIRSAVRAWREAWIDEWLEREVRPIVRLFDPHRSSFFGQDFARSFNLSVIAAGQLDAASVLQNRLGIEMFDIPFWAQFRILNWLCRAMPRWSCGKMDARGNGQQLAEDMQEEWGASRIEAVMATEKVYLARMPRVKARFDDRTIGIPRDEGVVEDLRLIKLVKGVPKVVDQIDAKVDGAQGKRHGDYSIAIMNLVGAADENVIPIEAAATGTQRAAASDYALTATGFGTVRRVDAFGARGGF